MGEVVVHFMDRELRRKMYGMLVLGIIFFLLLLYDASASGSRNIICFVCLFVWFGVMVYCFCMEKYINMSLCSHEIIIKIGFRKRRYDYTELEKLEIIQSGYGTYDKYHFRDNTTVRFFANREAEQYIKDRNIRIEYTAR